MACCDAKYGRQPGEVLVVLAGSKSRQLVPNMPLTNVGHGRRRIGRRRGRARRNGYGRSGLGPGRCRRGDRRRTVPRASAGRQIVFDESQHFVRPHASLRVALGQPLERGGRRQRQRYRQRTPAMAAGLSKTVMDWSEIAEAADADAPAPKRGPYKKPSPNENPQPKPGGC